MGNSVIYTPSGRAGEYASLACNLFRGCDHRCVYCYAPDVIHMQRDAFHVPAYRDGLLANLAKSAEARCRQRLPADSLFEQAPKTADNRDILLCFTTDPYQAFDVDTAITREAITILHRYGFTVTTLTKGGSRALRDIDLFTPADTFASTLTLLDDDLSREWEPNAALPEDRIATLQAFHARGIPTWVSLEPVIDPDAAVEIVRRCAGFVDMWKVGTLNYHPHGKTIDWQAFARRIAATLDAHGARYLLKDDLAAYLTT